MTRSRRRVFSALIVAGVLWGSTVPLSKLALVWLSPAWLGFTRFALAAVILMLVSRGRLRAAASPAILVTGALGYGGSVVLQNFGIERTSVTHAALLIGATPVLVAIIAAVWHRSVARPVAWAGFGLSLAGVAIIAAGRGAGASLGGDGLVLAGQLASAAFTASQSRLLPGRDPIAVTAVQLMAAAVVTLPLALVSGGTHAGQPSLTAVLATAALVVAGTVGPTTLFAYGQSRVSADVAGAFLNLEPLVGAILGTLVFADPVGPAQLAGGTAILTGIAMSSLHAMRSSMAPARSAAPSPARAAVSQHREPASSLDLVAVPAGRAAYPDGGHMPTWRAVGYIRSPAVRWPEAGQAHGQGLRGLEGAHANVRISGYEKEPGSGGGACDRGPACRRGGARAGRRAFSQSRFAHGRQAGPTGPRAEPVR